MTTYPVSSNFCEKRISGMLRALQFSIFLVSSFIRNFLFISFQQKNEKKKGKYSRIDLFEVKDFKGNSTDGT